MGKTSIKSKHGLSTILQDIYIYSDRWKIKHPLVQLIRIFRKKHENPSNLPHGQSGPSKNTPQKVSFSYYRAYINQYKVTACAIYFFLGTRWSNHVEYQLRAFSGWLPCHPPRTWVLDCPTVGVAMVEMDAMFDTKRVWWWSIWWTKIVVVDVGRLFWLYNYSIYIYDNNWSMYIRIW